MQNNKKQPTKTQTYAFYALTLTGTLGILRNIWRMSRKAKQYINFIRVASNHDDLNEVMSILDGGNAQKQVILESVLPNFKENYFQTADDFKKFKSLRGNFYENLLLERPFEGFLSTKKKEYKIEFTVNLPRVSLQLVNLARSFDEKGSQFNKIHPVCVYGFLKFQQNKKKIVFDTKMIALNGLSMVKYFQIHLISIVLSTFFYSILLGVAIAIYFNRKVIDQIILKQWIQTIFQTNTIIQTKNNKLPDNL